jgi:hypothetical protein
MLFASSNVDFEALWVPILLTVLVVMVVRAVSVYAVVLPINAFSKKEHMPKRRGPPLLLILLLESEPTAPQNQHYCWQKAYSQNKHQ